jgi:UDP-N-acetylmuramate: L-alanyl-gamma-D-glutamyl-meso-diaminopimelate ligase
MTQPQPKVHFIAIGGSAMHNLAIALHKKEYKVTGSDDAIAEPSLGRLQGYGLLPESIGWFPEKITTDLDAVILGMHARVDNPELLKAQELGLRIYSYPEYVHEQSKDKQRVVIAGSHGKTTITSMILHVLKYHKKDFDYLVGAQIEGFDTMVRLTEEAPVIIIEGDEYLSSPIDSRPKFLHYHHHIGLVSGVAWDHINVFPTLDMYVRQFDHFADSSPKGGTLIYCEEDDLASVICKKEREDVTAIEYGTHKNEIVNGQTYLINKDKEKIAVEVFGEHNMRNISGARAVCSRIGITDKMFYEAISSFKGAANRLEILAKNESTTVFKDFAHAPSKLKATCKAVKKQFPDRKLVACLELHTFSSLNKNFISQYSKTFNAPDEAIVYYNEEVLKHKKLEMLSPDEVKKAFGREDLRVITNSKALQELLRGHGWKNTNLLMMSSGTFDGMNLRSFAKELTNS